MLKRGFAEARGLKILQYMKMFHLKFGMIPSSSFVRICNPHAMYIRNKNCSSEIWNDMPL